MDIYAAAAASGSFKRSDKQQSIKSYVESTDKKSKKE